MAGIVVGGEGEIRFTVTITRAADAAVETHEMVGKITAPEEGE